MKTLITKSRNAIAWEDKEEEWTKESVLDLFTDPDCLVRQLLLQVENLEKAIRKHRDQKGDDRCWLDDEELYKSLPEGYTPPERDSKVELKNCEKYIACRHNPNTVYTSPEKEIERLRGLLKEIYQHAIPIGCDWGHSKIAELAAKGFKNDN